MKLFKIQLLLLAFVLASCGFGEDDADPLQGRDSETFVSQSEKAGEDSEWQENFDQETKKYEDSIAENNQKVARLQEDMDQQFVDFKAGFEKQSLTKKSEWEAARASFIAEYEKYKNQCEASHALQKETIKSYSQQVTGYKEAISGAETQSLPGFWGQFSAEEADARSFTWSVGEEKKYKIKFELEVKDKVDIRMDIEPDLPKGFSIEGDGNGSWFLVGKPTAELAISEEEGRFAETYTITPEIVDKSQISDARARAAISREDFSEEILIVVNKSKDAPTVDWKICSRNGQKFLKVSVSDKATSANAKLDQAPIVQIVDRTGDGRDGTNKVNGATLVSVDPSQPTAKLSQGIWSYSFRVNDELANIPDSVKTFEAAFAVEVMSRKSGLMAPPVESINYNSGKEVDESCN